MNENTASIAFRTRFAWLMKCLASVMCAIALAFSVGAVANSIIACEAHATIYATDDVTDEESADDASADDEAAASGEESIDDDETPMSSGLGGGEPVSSGGVGLAGFIIAGIAAVAAFFFVLVRKQNGSIRSMNQMFK